MRCAAGFAAVLLLWSPPAADATAATSALLQRLELPADYAGRLDDCGLGDIDSSLRGASMSQLMGCGLKVGH
eukprot:COSAG06_NODE_2033_length_7784_cov_6.798699_1_plen_71_part_10